jgi:hypothetical protein
MATVAFVAIPIGISNLLKKHPRSEIWLLLLIFGIALGVRLYWVQMVPTGQVSDFGRFHYRALQLARGEPDLFINKYSVFTRLLSLVYRISPSVDLVIVINIFLSLLSIFCLYWIGKEIGNPVAGVLAGYFFSIFPSEISMVGIVCTDIPAATILLLIAALLIHYFKAPKWYWLAGAGLLFAIIFRIRAHMLMYFPIFLVPIFFSKFHSWKKIVQFGATFLISFLLGITMINGIVNQISVEGMEIEESKNIILPLVNGTNIAAKGRISNADLDLVESWTPDEAWDNGVHLVIRRVFSDPLAYYNLLKTKFDHVFANGVYGADLAFIDERMDYSVFQTEWQHPTQDVRKTFSLISQYAYWCILGYALFFAFLRADKLKVIGWMIFTLLYSAFGTYIFFEVQPRYQRPIIPFILFAAALALSVWQGSVHQGGLRKEQ